MSEESRIADVFDQIAEEYSQRIRSGEDPSLDEYVQRHPDLESKIRRLFPLLYQMEQEADSADSGGGLSAEREFLEEELKKLDHLPPQKQLGDYRIIREIGRGGMGIVYEAEQESLGRRVALKILPHLAHFDPRRLQRFQQEARSSAQLHHTNIVPIFGVGRDEQMSYMVMQLIDGASLDKVIHSLRGSRFPDESASPPDTAKLGKTDVATSVAHQLAARDLEADHASSPNRLKGLKGSDAEIGESHSAYDGTAQEWPASASHVGNGDRSATSASSLSNGFQYFRNVAQIGVQAGNALEYAHNAGILHRDIKPGNLIVDSDCKVWVTDFGLAKSIDQQGLTRTGETVGTLRYLPPEQLEGRSDARSDVYSLGLTLYEMLCLKPAFDDQEYAQLVRHLTDSEPVSPRKLNPRVPRDLNTVVLKAISKEPSRRYGTAGEMVADLQRFLDGKPIAAKQVSEFDRLVKAIRRWPVVSALVLLLLISLVVGTGLVAWQWRKTSLALSKAQEEATTRNDVLDFFMGDVLGQASPETNNGQNMKLRTALDRAVTQLGSRFQTKPLVEAEIRAVVGRTLVELGEVNHGETQVQLALQLREQHLPENHPDVWESRQDWIMVLNKRSRHQESLELMDEMLSRSEREEIGRDRESLLVDKATILTNLARYDEAESILVEIRTTAESEGRDDMVHQCDMRINELAFNRGQFQASADASRSLVQRLTASTGDATHPDVISARNLLAMSLDNLKQHDAAEEIYWSIYEDAMSKLGASHFETLAISNNLIISLMHQGKLDDAEKVLQPQIALLTQEVGLAHEDTLGAMNNLGVLYMMRGDLDRAVATFEEIRQPTLELLGEQHPDTVTNMNNLASLYFRKKRWTEAEEMYQGAIELGLEVWSEKHPNVINTIAGLGKVQARLEKNQEALANYERALSLSRDVMGTTHPDTLITRREYGRLLMALGDLEKAETQLREQVEAYEELEDRESEAALRARLDLATVVQRQGRAADACDLFAETYTMRKEARGGTEPGTLAALFLVTQKEHELSRHDEIIEKLGALIEQNPESQSWWFYRAQSRLGRAFMEKGDLEKAEAVLQNAYEGFSGLEPTAEFSASQRRSELRSAAARLIRLFKKREDPKGVETWKAVYDQHRE